MITYVITLAVIILLVFLYHRSPEKYKYLILLLIGIILISVAGLRYRVGTDYNQYTANYKNYLHGDWKLANGGLIFIAKITSLINCDYAIWFFAMSALTIGLVIYVIKKHSTTVGFSIIIYMLLGCWHTSFNAVKQCAAASIILCGYYFLQNRKFIRWCIVCFIASLFHVTAILMIPVYFLATNKVGKRNIFLIIAIGVICFFSYDYLFEVVGYLKQGEGVTKYNSDNSQNSVNILRVLVACAPVVFCMVNYKKYDFKDSTFAIPFNLSLLNMVANIASMQSIYMSRFCIYTNIFNIFFVPILVKPFKKQERILLYGGLFVLYFIFWYYDLYKCAETVNYQWIFSR